MSHWTLTDHVTLNSDWSCHIELWLIMSHWSLTDHVTLVSDWSCHISRCQFMTPTTGWSYHVDRCLFKSHSYWLHKLQSSDDWPNQLKESLIIAPHVYQTEFTGSINTNSSTKTSQALTENVTDNLCQSSQSVLSVLKKSGAMGLKVCYMSGKFTFEGLSVSLDSVNQVAEVSLQCVS